MNFEIIIIEITSPGYGQLAAEPLNGEPRTMILPQCGDLFRVQSGEFHSIQQLLRQIQFYDRAVRSFPILFRLAERIADIAAAEKR